ncbi:MAG: DUF6429 family protein [Clostridium sp.]|nr:DUF6429 family protein [Clostridium sp.]
MDKTTAEQAMKELTMVLLYLSRWTEKDRFSDGKDFYAWKGYDFGILNELDDGDYIHQGNHPSRSKSVYITETGIQKAHEFLEKYNIADWENKNSR